MRWLVAVCLALSGCVSQAKPESPWLDTPPQCDRPETLTDHELRLCGWGEY